jgi:hypothetical protein
VFVSRQAVFYTTTFMGVGAYLLLTAAGGYYVRQFGGSWGHLGQVVFLGGALLLLVLLWARSVLRRRARVFLSKHFLSQQVRLPPGVAAIHSARCPPAMTIGRAPHCHLRRSRRSSRALPASLWLADEASARFVAGARWPATARRARQIEALPATPTCPRSWRARSGSSTCASWRRVAGHVR